MYPKENISEVEPLQYFQLSSTLTSTPSVLTRQYCADPNYFHTRADDRRGKAWPPSALHRQSYIR